MSARGEGHSFDLCPISHLSSGATVPTRANFIWSIHRLEEQRFFRTVGGNMTKVAAMPIYGKKRLKTFFFGTDWPMSLKLGI